MVFYDGNPTSGGTELGSGTASTTVAGQWTLPWSFPTAGTQSIYAVYTPVAGNLNGSTGAANLSVGKDSTTTTLASSANPSVLGQPVTFTATVAVKSPGASTPSGTMTFKQGATVLASGVPVIGGVATFTTSSLAQGANSITAVYSGDTNEAASTSAAVSEKILSATTVSLTSSSLSATAGTVTYTATLSDVAGTGTPTGTVSFYYGTNSTDRHREPGRRRGEAEADGRVLPAGSYVIYAVYNGDTTHQTSTSSTINETLS